MDRPAHRLEWVSTYNQSFDARRSEEVGRDRRSPSPFQGNTSMSPSKGDLRSSFSTNPSPEPKRTRLRLAPLEGAFVLPGSLCQLDQLGISQEVGRSQARKGAKSTRPLFSLQTQDIDGATAKPLLPKISPVKTTARTSSTRRERPSVAHHLAGLGLLEQLQTAKKPVPAQRSRYLVMGKGKSLRLYGHYEVAGKVGEALNASM